MFSSNTLDIAHKEVLENCRHLLVLVHTDHFPLAVWKSCKNLYRKPLEYDWSAKHIIPKSPMSIKISPYKRIYICLKCSFHNFVPRLSLQGMQRRESLGICNARQTTYQYLTHTAKELYILQMCCLQREGPGLC